MSLQGGRKQANVYVYLSPARVMAVAGVQEYALGGCGRAVENLDEPRTPRPHITAPSSRPPDVRSVKYLSVISAAQTIVSSCQRCIMQDSY